MDQQDLLELKEKIDSAKEKAAELKGRKQGLMKELTDDWGCSTVAEAEKKIKAIAWHSDQLMGSREILSQQQKETNKDVTKSTRLTQQSSQSNTTLS